MAIETKTLAEIYIDRMNATRTERMELMERAGRCSEIESLIASGLSSLGFSVGIRADGSYELGGRI